MLTKSTIIVAALALAGEFASASLVGSDGMAKEKHTRMLKRRSPALNGTADNGPCKRGDGAGSSQGSWNNVKVIATTGNLTIVPSSFAAEGQGQTRRPLSESSSSTSDSSSQWSSSEDTRQALQESSSSDQSSSSWSSEASSSSSSWAPAPSASIHAGAGSAPSSGMSVVTSWSGSDVSTICRTLGIILT